MKEETSNENYVANRIDGVLRIEKITKLEAAQRQLRTACRLFFTSADSVSVHTLAWAVHEILDKHPESAKSLLIDIANESPESAKAHAELTEARNFFKHYHNKPWKTIHFIENLNEWLLIDCGQMYRSVTGTFIKEVAAVNAWVSVQRNITLLNNIAVIEHFQKLNLPKTEFLTTFLSLEFRPGFE
ncbi:MAG: hypothetical protein AB7L09_03675 [Nitrospira sp.]